MATFSYNGKTMSVDTERLQQKTGTVSYYYFRALARDFLNILRIESSEYTPLYNTFVSALGDKTGELSVLTALQRAFETYKPAPASGAFDILPTISSGASTSITYPTSTATIPAPIFWIIGAVIIYLFIRKGKV